MEPRRDGDIIRLSLADPRTFSTIFERYVSDISRYVRRRADSAIAEDLVAEVFLTAFRTRSSFETRSLSARPWLYGIASNVLRHHYRSKNRQLKYLTEKSDADFYVHGTQDEGLSEAETRLDSCSHHPTIEAAIRQLDPEMVEPLLLFAYAELTYEEIGRALDLPLGTVRSRISRSRKRLRELLGPLKATTE